MIVERFKLSIAEDIEGYITDKNKHKTYFLRSDNAKKEITGILNQLYNENEDLKTDISVLNRYYDKYADICAKLKKENEQLKKEIKQLNHDLDLYEENNTNEVLNKLRIELTSRMNDCIEEFKE